MRQIIAESKDIILRRTQIEDLDYVLASEREQENAKYVGQWTREQHIDSLSIGDMMHLIVEEAETGKAVGYIIMAGLENPNNSIEFRRIAISDKGKGYGRAALKLIKRMAFEQLKAHRLWLDVRSKNLRAQSLYQSEGFIIEGTHRECIHYNGEYESLIVMSILESEY